MHDSTTLTRYTGALAAAVLTAASLSVALSLPAEAAPTHSEHANTSHNGTEQSILMADGQVTFVVTKGQKG